MKVCRTNGIEWFLADDSLVPVVEALTFKEDARRGYSVREWQGRKVFVKSFSEKGIAGLIRNRISSRGKREFELARSLLSFSIATPEPLGYGVSRQASYIVEEWIEGENLLKVFQEGKGRTDLLAGLAELLKRMKEHCLRHNDLHLENILLSKDRLYLIDLHTMQIKKSFSKEDEISNLSHALAMIYDDMNEGESDTFFRHYEVQDIRGPLEAEIQRLRERWVRSKKNRAFQGTSRIIADGEYLRVSGFEERGSGRLVAVIKDDTKVRVERMDDHIRKIYRKRRRLARAWRNHVMLLYMNLAVTPQPYYLKRPSFSSDGLIAMEDLKAKGEELDQYIDRRYTATTGAGQRDFIRPLADFLRGLFKKRICHRDMKGCNVFVLESGGFLLLDVEDITYGDVGEEGLKRLLLQLNTTIPKRVSDRHRIRFFLRLTAGMKVDRKGVFRDVLQESRGREIVYEGAGGLVRESW